MTTATDWRELAARLAVAAIDGGPGDWLSGAKILERLDGRSWLLLDQAARRFTPSGRLLASGGWLGTGLGEPTGFVAAVTSLHVDGRIRERATQVLAANDSRIASAALAVRLLDHVAQVRTRAEEGLRPRLGPDTAEVVLDVLLAGRDRQHADRALRFVADALLKSSSASELFSVLAASDRRRVRRWAYAFGHGQGLLSPEQLVDAARDDPDQWVRGACADWLMTARGFRDLATLLDAKFVEARLVALSRVTDADLSDDALTGLLTDSAPRVRQLARWRARRRGFDVASFYRQELTNPAAAARVRAACLDGIGAVGDETDLPACVSHLDDASARVRVAAVSGVHGRAPRSDALRILTPVLLDSSARVGAAAARALAQLGVPASAAEPAWASDRPATRRAAWRLSRAAGGWQRVEADLRAAVDPDPQLASVGRTGIENWLAFGAASTYQQLPPEQQARMADLLASANLDEQQARTLAFHAGITVPSAAPTTPKRRRWLRLLGRD